MSTVLAGITKTQDDIRRLETFIADFDKDSGNISIVNQRPHMEIFLHTGIELAVVAAMLIRQGQSGVRGKKIYIKLAIEADYMDS